jgi:hypothetical protein
MIMREWSLLFVLLLVSSAALAENPEVAYSNPVSPDATHCGVWTGTTSPAKVATVPVAHGRCEFNYADWLAGSYKIRFTEIAGEAESPLSPDSVTAKRTNYVTFYRWQKTISWKCPTGKPCIKE